MLFDKTMEKKDAKGLVETLAAEPGHILYAGRMLGNGELLGNAVECEEFAKANGLRLIHVAAEEPAPATTKFPLAKVVGKSSNKIQLAMKLAETILEGTEREGFPADPVSRKHERDLLALFIVAVSMDLRKHSDFEGFSGTVSDIELLIKTGCPACIEFLCDALKDQDIVSLIRRFKSAYDPWGHSTKHDVNDELCDLYLRLAMIRNTVRDVSDGGIGEITSRTSALPMDKIQTMPTEKRDHIYAEAMEIKKLHEPKEQKYLYDLCGAGSLLQSVILVTALHALVENGFRDAGPNKLAKPPAIVIEDLSMLPWIPDLHQTILDTRKLGVKWYTGLGSDELFRRTYGVRSDLIKEELRRAHICL